MRGDERLAAEQFNGSPNSCGAVPISPTPSATYLNTVKASAKQRAALGDRRLADLLNTALAVTPVTVSRFEAE